MVYIAVEKCPVFHADEVGSTPWSDYKCVTLVALDINVDETRLTSSILQSFRIHPGGPQVYLSKTVNYHYICHSLDQQTLTGWLFYWNFSQT